MVLRWLIVNRVDPERARRIIIAVLQNIENWEQRLIEIEEHAIPGNKARVLALMRDVHFAKVSLCRLANLEGEQVCQTPADAPTEGWSQDKPPLGPGEPGR